MNMRWIVGFTVIIMLFGTLFGIFAGGLNPWINPAKAERINIENAHKQAVYELQEQLAQAQTEADIQDLQREQRLLEAQYQHNIQKLEQDLAHREIAFRTMMAVLTKIGGGFSVALAISTTIWVGSKAVATIKSAPETVINSQSAVSTTHTNHRSPSRDAQKARQREREEREREIGERQALAERLNRFIRESEKVWPGNEESENIEANNYPWAR